MLRFTAAVHLLNPANACIYIVNGLPTSTDPFTSINKRTSFYFAGLITRLILSIGDYQNNQWLQSCLELTWRDQIPLMRLYANMVGREIDSPGESGAAAVAEEEAVAD